VSSIKNAILYTKLKKSPFNTKFHRGKLRFYQGIIQLTLFSAFLFVGIKLLFREK